MPGYEVAAKLEKMGWHSSDTAELAFTDVEVPAENLLGEENGGFKLIMANFAWERLLMAIGAVGGMQRLIETTVAYAKDREAFGRPIGRLPGDPPPRRRDGDLRPRPRAPSPTTPCASSTAARTASATSAWPSSSPSAPLLEVADQALQIHGGYGYMREYGIERAVRDARLGPIGGGTDEIMKEILGKTMGL